ncbi:MAG: ABC transporter ATP-binding protein [Acidobacteria bacterium]|nr:MAG: ABC transporter ATP-binding protein [Acidobacteriota bacterium]
MDADRDSRSATPLLEVSGLSVAYDGAAGRVLALDRLSLALAPGEIVGLLGESGCGKTTLARAILGLLPAAGRRLEGTVRFRGRAVESLPRAAMRRLRGAEIALVAQEPALALHPMRRVGSQIAEVLRAHRPWSWRRCRREAAARLAEVGLEPGSIAGAYPHQLSGGQRQRVAVAQALACRPALVVADEPTASLDVASARRVLALLRRLCGEHHSALLLISHQPEVLAVAERLALMYAGRVVEEGPAAQFLSSPLHPYGEALLACRPPAAGGAGRRLATIPGAAPLVAEAVAGCSFAPRCAYRMDECTTRDPPPASPAGERRVWCLRYEA